MAAVESHTPASASQATVRRVGWLHFLNDLTLDFLTPLLPAGISAAWIGVMEGIADAVGHILKLITGRASDASGKRAVWVKRGYIANATARPLIGIGMLCLWPWWIVLCRVGDRVGKGLRGSATDALISDWTTTEQRGRVFARMRMMDHLGATVGASAAAVVAATVPLEHLGWAVIALLPFTLVVVWVCRGLRDAPSEPIPPIPITKKAGWWPSDRAPRRALLAITIAGCASRLSPLLVLVTVAGLPTGDETNAWPLWLVCFGWAAFGIVQSFAAALTGPLVDRLGAVLLLRYGWLLLAIAVALLGSNNATVLVVAGLLVGLVTGALDGVEKTWLSTLVPRSERGTTFGALALVGAAATLIGNGACTIWLSDHAAALFLALAATSVLGIGCTFLGASQRPD